MDVDITPGATVRSTSRSTTAVPATNAPSATDAASIDYSARREEEIAAHFPVPSGDVADRLVDLLLPRECPQPKGEEAA
ncbi:MAG TPA: hypothetical protein VK908_18270 [Jiangellales bacterium]|nr:hypothetical protein [Jiangellales bacterium]